MFVCPICKSDLLKHDTYYLCNSCNHNWPIREGIPIFLKEDVPYWCELTKDQAAQLLKEAEEIGTGYIKSKSIAYKLLSESPVKDRILTLFPTLVFGGDHYHPYSHISSGLIENIKVNIEGTTLNFKQLGAISWLCIIMG